MGRGGLAVAIIRGNKQGVIVFSGAQTVTAGMVSWCADGALCCRVGWSDSWSLQWDVITCTYHWVAMFAAVSLYLT